MPRRAGAGYSEGHGNVPAGLMTGLPDEWAVCRSCADGSRTWHCRSVFTKEDGAETDDGASAAARSRPDEWCLPRYERWPAVFVLFNPMSGEKSTPSHAPLPPVVAGAPLSGPAPPCRDRRPRVGIGAPRVVVGAGRPPMTCDAGARKVVDGRPAVFVLFNPMSGEKSTANHAPLPLPRPGHPPRQGAAPSTTGALRWWPPPAHTPASLAPCSGPPR